MMYMTPGEASIRLQERHGIATELFIGDVLAASEELRGMAPFVEGVDVDDPDTLPGAVLDWIALRAHEFRQTITGPPPASSIKTGDVTVQLELGKGHRDLHKLVYPYLKHRGRVA
jgi:hypothetical protein